jgi:phenylpyruvate tautomerase PptA (4-oxalocrotonate tautomerase family)
MPEVVVYLLEGRSLEQKRGLVKDITQAVVQKAKGGVLFSEMTGH